MNLGLDISSAKIGLALLDDKKNICLTKHIKFDNSLSLEERASLFEIEIGKLEDPNTGINISNTVKNIFIEKPFVAAGGGSSNAFTVAKLHRFNGMCSYIVYKLLKVKPVLIEVRTARKKLGIVIPRSKSKKKKQYIIDYVVDRYKNTKTPYKIRLTRYGNPGIGVDDECDAIVLVLAGLES